MRFDRNLNDYQPLAKFAHLSTNSATTNATGDYSSAAVNFVLAPAQNETFYVYKLSILVEDATNFAKDNYGNLSTLTNGVTIKLNRRNGKSTTLTPIAIKTNGQWGQYSQAELKINFTSGGEALTVGMNFEEVGGPLLLDGNNGDNISIILNDNFTGLQTHTFFFQGIIK